MITAIPASGREVRAEPKLELPKLQAGLPMLRTGLRWAGTYLTPQQRPCPDWTVTARGLRGKPIGPGREVRAEPKLELPEQPGGPPNAADRPTVGRPVQFILQDHS